jgi:hypothetical protein
MGLLLANPSPIWPIGAMNRSAFKPLGLLAPILVTVVLCLSGCAATSQPGSTGGSRVTKERGVYTTIATGGQNLDLAGSSYTSCHDFAPGQTPAAVVLGTGNTGLENPNSPQPYQLQLIESASGAVMQNLGGQVYPGKADIFDLPIRKSGQYQLKLIINGSVYDTWDFTVNRNDAPDTAVAAAPAPAAPPPVYAKGNFSVSIEPQPNTDMFMQYDDTFMFALNDAVRREINHSTNQDEFVQVPAGHVIIQFDLSAGGQASAAKIIENTISDPIGQFFLRVLQNGSPYKAWPAEAHAAIGTDTRTMKVTFFYD